jgi:hypothetical protein
MDSLQKAGPIEAGGEISRTLDVTAVSNIFLALIATTRENKVSDFVCHEPGGASGALRNDQDRCGMVMTMSRADLLRYSLGVDRPAFEMFKPVSP